MNVGLPGTGIGGIFYLAMAFVMPFYHLWTRFRKKHKSYEAAKTQVVSQSVLLAGGILLALWAQVAFLRWVLDSAQEWLRAKLAGDALYNTIYGFLPSGPGALNGTLILGANLGSLVFIYVCVRLAGLWTR